ncbi:hypothetical protein M404DRAFT_148067 [Pisolithus tinctorius Marx 270]|uniref:GYF domain-containing protein n=1 Tax=Pisolithus tinctorius Marx 270 TaxID=870435 RepID=A0A0C3P4F5_PISTI|nr:hypothetical protein M404DRAFT_148067 [Pisolithus tinctorius Marx 270]
MTTTMHFGPEWMRSKPQTPARQQPPPSPQPQQTVPATHQSTVSTYSSLVTSAVQEQEKHDESRPFRYTKEEMLRIYKEGGGKGGLGLEVERWEGIVHEAGSEPASLREMDEAEKKLFAGPLNSEIRRRQPSDLVNTLSSTSDRPRVNHVGGGGGPVRDRFGPMMGRRRESADQAALMPRKLSLSNTQGSSLASPREALSSPRNRMGTFGSGFDGVLNNGDSWSRRRPSASLVGTAGTPARPEGKDVESRHSHIKEEEVHVPLDVDEDDSPGTDQQLPSASPDRSRAVSADDSQPSTSIGSSVVQGIADMNLGEPNNLDMSLQITTATSAPVTGPPPGLPDSASVEWSYLDPQGQVQGPFRADVMQKWFDEGYFTPELLMKRTHLDVEWIPVATLERRSNGGKVFLSQPLSVPGPPGLTLRTESPHGYSPAHEHSTFDGHQPVPQRAVRSATLDPSYLSNVSPSDSPSSSLGAATFGDGSPDPTVFGSRSGGSAYSGDISYGGRGLAPRVQPQDPVADPRVPFNNRAPGRATSLDTFGSYNEGTPWSTGLSPLNQGFSTNERHPFSDGYSSITSNMIGPNIPVTQVHGFNQEPFNDAPYNDMGGLGGHQHPPLAKQVIEANGIAFSNGMINGLGESHYNSPTRSQYSQPSASFPPSAQHQTVSPFGEALTQPSVSPHVSHPPTSAVQANSGTSPWPDPSPVCRTRTVDTSATSSPAVTSAQAQQGFNWARPIQPPQAVPQLNDPSPWLTASLGGTDDRWKEIPDGQGAEDVFVAGSPVDGGIPTLSIPQTPADELPVASAVPIPASQPVPPSSEPQVTSKPSRKSTAHDAHASVTVTVPKGTPASVVKGPSPVPIISPPAPKSVWSSVDEERKAKPAATMSLREIQEAEAKMTEARKASEKERERARSNIATSLVASGSEDAQPFTASWGLLTSQAGGRNIAAPKEPPTPVTPSAPVWTTAAPTATAKKSMKEIQEEEERRKKVVVRESVASAAARRPYAETTFKTAPSVQNTGSGAWTTIGANGKPATPVAAPPRPAATTPGSAVAVGSPAAVPRQHGAATRPGTSAATLAPTKPAATPRAEDSPVTPSHDFLKWLSDSLKGLNSSVNLEEITSMLFSFPLDPDPSTIEIISDLIYANSTTLNGRRFASEYVNKRKADAAARRNAAGVGGSSGKPISIADVVKTQPKTVQQEWGFKVVNKKKKGGRS